jgi:hypothetical protein
MAMGRPKAELTGNSGYSDGTPTACRDLLYSEAAMGIVGTVRFRNHAHAEALGETH